MKVLVGVLALDPMHWYRVQHDVFEEARTYARQLFGEANYKYKIRESNGEHAVVEVWKDLPEVV